MLSAHPLVEQRAAPHFCPPLLLALRFPTDTPAFLLCFLLHTRYEGEVPHVLPYFIAADEETKSVVVAIRGGLGRLIESWLHTCSPSQWAQSKLKEAWRAA